MDSKMEYIITLKPDAPKADILDDLSRDTTNDQSVDSNEIPDKEISIISEQPGFQRTFTAQLESDDVKVLNNNPNVRAVEVPLPEPEEGEWDDSQSLIVRRVPHNSPNALGPTGSGANANTMLDNWGLMFHSNQSSDWTFTLSSTERAFTWANTARAGEGVDFIIQDSGHPDSRNQDFGHPESGVSRIVPFDWRTLNNCSHVLPAGYGPGDPGFGGFKYHATLCASVAVGKKYGWAKYANLYSAPWGKKSGLGSSENSFLAIKEFHLMKIRDVAANGASSQYATNTVGGLTVVRPTVVNGSWGAKAYGEPITSVGFRGNTTPFNRVMDIDGPPRAPVAKFGCIGSYVYSNGNVQARNRFNIASEAMRAQCQEMTDVGVIYVKSAGNQKQKIDCPGGLDYDNFITTGQYPNTPVFYNRGSGNISNNTIVVGALQAPFMTSAGEVAASFSERGRRVDIWAAGQYIYGAYLAGSGADSAIVASGTSFSTPQVAGMVACIASKYPNTTPAQMHSFVRMNTAFHTSNAIFAGGSNVFGGDQTPTATAGANNVDGDPDYWGHSWAKYNLMGSGLPSGPGASGNTYPSGNVAYLNAALPNDPSQLVYGVDTLADINYAGHTDPVVIGGPYPELNYHPDTANATLSRFGTTGAYRYFKFVAYDDFARTVPSVGTGNSCSEVIDIISMDDISFLGQGADPLTAAYAEPIPTTGIVSTTYSVFDGTPGGENYTVSVGSDHLRSGTSGIQYYGPANAVDHNLSPRHHSYWGGNRYRFRARAGVATELFVSFSKVITPKNIRTCDSFDSGSFGTPIKFWDIYASLTPFTETIGITNEGDKIGEFNRADMWIQPTLGYSANIGEPNYLEGMNTDEGGCVSDCGDTNDMWNPFVSPSGWHKIPVELASSLLGDTAQFVANATIS